MFTTIVLTRVGLLLLGLAALVLDFRQKQAQKPWFDADRVLALLGLVGALSFTNFGLFHGPGFGLIHPGEMYTYYASAKYAPELRYDGLYVATLAADAESPNPRLGDATAGRDLTTGEIVPIAALRADERIRARFTDERWSAFSHDAAYFLSEGTMDYWKRVLRDHGYNAPPSRTALLAGIVAWLGPANAVSVHAIAALDVLLLLALLAVVFRTFGLRVAALVAIFLGSNSLSAYEWIGGSFLREDWLAASVLGACALRSGRSGLAGGLFGLAAMLRVFPGLFAAFVILGGAVRFVRERRLDPEIVRFAVGGAVAVLALGLPSLLLPGGLGAWQAFLGKITEHVAHVSSNDVGLPVLLAGSDSMLRVAQAALLVACAAVAGRVRGARAAALGAALVYGFGVLSCYYYSLLVLPLLWRRLDDVDPAALVRVGAVFAVPAVAGLIEATSRHAPPTYDPLIFSATSWMLLATFAVLLALAARESGGQAGDELATESSPQGVVTKTPCSEETEG